MHVCFVPHRNRIRKFTERKLSASVGVAVVEMALILPTVMLLIMGILELGRGWMNYNLLTHAVREGARMAAVQNNLAMDDERIKDHIDVLLEKGGLEAESVSIMRFDLDRNDPYLAGDIFSGDTISVRAVAHFRPVVSSLFTNRGPFIPLSAEVITVYEN